MIRTDDAPPVPSKPLAVFLAADASRTQVPYRQAHFCGCWERVEGDYVTAYGQCDQHKEGS